MKILNYSHMATVIWAFTSVKYLMDFQNEFWNAYTTHLESLLQNDNSEKSIYHTIIIAKGLSYVDPEMKKCVIFWKQFKDIFQDKDNV